jgi:sugar phosphate isomerase/epimerase
MQILLLATQWGAEDLPFEDFIDRTITGGYDGVDTWVPESAVDRRQYRQLLNRYNLPVVCHQHQATGNSIGAFCKSFEYYLNLCMEWDPILINSHSGRDYFSLDEQLKVLDVASEFAVRNNITVAHETHRGRIGFSPYNSAQLFALRQEMCITADFSHWVCVTESFLENCSTILSEAMARTGHVHARVGFPQGPQVADPRVEEWKFANDLFMEWWLKIIRLKRNQGASRLTITPEFGPPPYMPTLPATGEPVSDQFAVNNYIKNQIKMQMPVD